jgi:hypothetical protein
MATITAMLLAGAMVAGGAATGAIH